MQLNNSNFKRRLIFLIPAYNEAENIPLLFENLSKYIKESACDYKIIVVDDGSTDDTAKIAETFNRSLNVKLVRVHPHKGVAEVFRRGFEAALDIAQENDLIITKEADNTSDLSILKAMIRKIDEGSDVALASCYAKGGRVENTTFDRLVISKAANLLLMTFFPIKNVHTYSSFYRIHKASILKEALRQYGENFITEENFSCMVEMLIKLSRMKIRISEVPMVLRCDFRRGKSKMNKRKTILGYFRLILKNFRI